MIEKNCKSCKNSINSKASRFLCRIKGGFTYPKENCAYYIEATCDTCRYDDGEHCASYFNMNSLVMSEGICCNYKPISLEERKMEESCKSCKYYQGDGICISGGETCELDNPDLKCDYYERDPEKKDKSEKIKDKIKEVKKNRKHVMEEVISKADWDDYFFYGTFDYKYSRLNRDYIEFIAENRGEKRLLKRLARHRKKLYKAGRLRHNPELIMKKELWSQYKHLFVCMQKNHKQWKTKKATDELCELSEDCYDKINNQCSECGANLRVDSEFCHRCGQEV